MNLIARALVALPLSWWVAGQLMPVTASHPICANEDHDADCVVVGSSSWDLDQPPSMHPDRRRKILLEQQVDLNPNDEPAVPLAPLIDLIGVIRSRSLAIHSRERVTLWLKVSADGRITSVDVRDADSVLAHDLIQALAEVRFSAARRAGVAIAVAVPLTITIEPRDLPHTTRSAVGARLGRAAFQAPLTFLWMLAG